MVELLLRWFCADVLISMISVNLPQSSPCMQQAPGLGPGRNRHRAIEVRVSIHIAKFQLRCISAGQQHFMCTASSTDTVCVLLCLCPEGLETPLGESYVSVAHQMLAEVRQVAPITVGAGNQPATFKPYLSALIKVWVGGGDR